LPLKFAVFPVSCRFTVALLTIKFAFADILEAITLPETSISTVVILLFEFTLLANTLPVRFILVPVAAPMLGVVSCAFALTTTLPPAISVVVLSTFTENTVPVSVKPNPA
jgi:hypothetical protein